MIAEKQHFVARANLARNLTYRQHVKWVYYFNLASAIGALLLGIGILPFQELRLLSINLLVVAPIHFIIAWRCVRPFAFSIVTVAPDGITIDLLGNHYC